MRFQAAGIHDTLIAMPITDGNKEKLKARLARAIGHLNTVHRMVDEKKYCIDVLHQLKAVQAALDATAEVMLRQHLETCVVDAIQKQDSERVIEELMQVFRKVPDLYAEGENQPAIKTLTAVAVSDGKTSESKTSESKKGCCC